MRGHRIRELARILDLVDRDQDLGRDFLVELHVLLELRDHRAAESLEFAAAFALVLVERSSAGRLEECSDCLGELTIRALGAPSTSTLTVPSGSLRSWRTEPTIADGMDRPGSGSSWAASFWATSRICLSSFMTSSSAARTSRARRTAARSCAGKTTMSRKREERDRCLGTAESYSRCSSWSPVSGKAPADAVAAHNRISHGPGKKVGQGRRPFKAAGSHAPRSSMSSLPVRIDQQGLVPCPRRLRG